MNRDDALERLHAAIDELTKPRRTTEQMPYWDTSRNRKFRVYLADHQALLVDLALAINPANTTQAGEHTRGVPGSRPPARLDAIDRLRAIETGTLEWLIRLELAPRHSVADNLRALGGEAGQLSDDLIGWLMLDACRWVIWARVVTGWAAPPYAPHAPCPACERIGGLRIRLEQRVGCCLVCGADWRADDGGIYVLAEHVRMWSEDESA